MRLRKHASDAMDVEAWERESMTRKRIPVRTEGAAKPSEESSGRDVQYEDQDHNLETEEAAAAVPESREKLEQALESWRDRALRLQAEMANYRRRQQKWAEERARAERVRLLRSLLSAADDLQRAMNAENADEQTLRNGLEATLENMMGLLREEGVEPISAAGEPFDPQWHEAIDTVRAAEGYEAGTVVEVVRKGYRLDDRILRPAQVVVAT
jgi:molecular chaperone GrpE